MYLRVSHYRGELHGRCNNKPNPDRVTSMDESEENFCQKARFLRRPDSAR